MGLEYKQAGREQFSDIIRPPVSHPASLFFGDCNMKEIPLTQGQFALVDDEDFELISQYNWYANKRDATFYAATSIKKGGKWTTLQMHRLVMDAQKGQEIDHRNGNGLYNCRTNLRFCTRSQNNQNRKPQGNGSSKYKGVSWCKSSNEWKAEIKSNYKCIWLGRFKNEIDAAKCYDKKAKELFGEFARTNFKEIITWKS